MKVVIVAYEPYRGTTPYLPVLKNNRNTITRKNPAGVVRSRAEKRGYVLILYNKEKIFPDKQDHYSVGYAARPTYKYNTRKYFVRDQYFRPKYCKAYFTLSVLKCDNGR